MYYKTTLAMVFCGASTAIILYIIRRDLYLSLGIIAGMVLTIWRFSSFMGWISAYIKPRGTANIMLKAAMYAIWSLVVAISAVALAYWLKPSAGIGIAISLGIYGIVMPAIMTKLTYREVG